ncbi:lytic transglycosylase domain-containing protein [Viridibacillus sp. YIM B01967]|uniref:Lytic transglycosylase domain-containing protein n=1 Tax=Viridibacillus soli TaxID=2798301 RepID=A0ABS1H727_9BACL|nr:lytic transglycosylase domain-containing protein [Viridibacillus soli]MBK3495221.1 lytic transglycosylase domain-containing protein [Viridibacillus soli]
MVNKKKQQLNMKLKLWLIILLIPVSIALYTTTIIMWQQLKELPMVKQFSKEEKKDVPSFDIEIPNQYIPVYQKAAKKYNVPWTLLAAHHRIETRFSSMKTLESPAGAVGHLQFMPCTFVGWSHPTCKDLGKGHIKKKELTSPKTIKKYGGYGVDANGDGIADPYNIEDAVYSAANYLAASGAADGKIKKAIYQYNHSEEYVDNVFYYYKLYEENKKELVYNSKIALKAAKKVE